MSRWIRYVWQALIGLGATEYPIPNNEVRAPRERLSDEAVGAAFRDLVAREWGSAAFSPAPPSHS